MEQPTKRLLRSKNNRVIAGVCGGIAEYYSIDATALRIIIALLTLWKGWFLVVYLIAWLLIPEQEAPASGDDRVQQVGKEMKDTVNRASEILRRADGGSGNTTRYIFGGVLVLVGALAITEQYVPWRMMRWDIVWPVLIILGGVLLMAQRRS